ncbi:MAG: preprotein translocase subunit SecG [Ruminococcaceae bacterium]|nr:preprotein translocase subunit SecG [Oscillospiraceae bacterium]
MIGEYILLSILLVSAIAIVVAVTLQKSNEGLSGSIAGGSETYYGKDKSAQTGKKLFKITLVACIVFALATLAVYVMQPDYSAIENNWQSASDYSYVFPKKTN